MSDRFNEFYMMQNQAKKFEQTGMDDKALELYLKIIEEYLPNNDFSFDRASTLLEKKFKYNEALAVCEKALEMIRTEKIQGDAERFVQKIQRISSKAHGPEVIRAATQKKEPEVFHFGIPGFRTHNKVFMGLGTAYYAFAAFASYPNSPYLFLFLISIAFLGSYGLEVMTKMAGGKAFGKAMLITGLSLVLAGYSVVHFPIVEAYWNVGGDSDAAVSSDGSGSGSGSTSEDTPDTDRQPPEIPLKYLTAMTKTADLHPATDFTDVILNGSNVEVSLVLKPGTSIDVAHQISEDMIKTLGSLMVSEKLKGPSKDYWGEVYDFYSVSINITSTLDEQLAAGSLNQASSPIQWE